MSLWVSPYRNLLRGRRGQIDGLLGSGVGRRFYVDDIGGNDANDGRSTGRAWQTLARVNGDTFEPSDRIRLIRDGKWREQFDMPSSGIAGNHIIVDAYGTGANPIINGSDIYTGWTVDGGSYSAAVATEPSVVFYDDVMLTENDGATNTVGANEWDWNAAELWVNVGEDPDLGTLEAGRRNSGIRAIQRSYITYRNIRVTKTNTNGINIPQNPNNVESLEFHNMTANYCGLSGMLAGGINNLVVRNSTFHGNIAEHGIYLSGAVGGLWSNPVIDRCTIYENGTHGIQTNPNGFSRIAGLVVQRCHIYGNTNAEVNDQCSIAAVYKNNIIRNAGTAAGLLFINYRAAQQAYAAINAEIYHNTLICDASATAGLVVYRYNSATFENNVVHAVDGAASIMVVELVGGDWGDLASDYNQIYYAGVANVFNYRTNWSNDLAGWQADSGGDANSDDADPAFVNLANDWHLLVGSPCRGAGAIDTGVTEDYDGVARPDPPTQPDIGAYQFVP